jgi:hypothetical protein
MGKTPTGEPQTVTLRDALKMAHVIEMDFMRLVALIDQKLDEESQDL